MIDLTGLKVGKLTAIEPTEKRYRGFVVWRCQCSCGNIKEVPSFCLTRKTPTKSCGCGIHDSRNATHRLSKHPSYSTWWGMMYRCYNPHFRDYYAYGGRGIKVCERWHSVENFIEDMGVRPKGLTIDRIDVNGDYEPKNCRWVDNIEQQNNKTTSHYIEYNGERMTIEQASRRFGINSRTLYYRIVKGWPIQEALFRQPSLHNRVSKSLK